jgi:hypothetical protein
MIDRLSGEKSGRSGDENRIQLADSPIDYPSSNVPQTMPGARKWDDRPKTGIIAAASG